VEGLKDQSKGPHKSAYMKATKEYEYLILELGKSSNLGDQRIRHQLERLHNHSFHLAAIYKVLTRNEVNLLGKLCRKKENKLFSAPY